MTPHLPEILEAVQSHAAHRERQADLRSLRLQATSQERRPFRAALEARPFSIIAEIKRASPSAGPLRPDLSVPELARTYESAGAAALSILTCRPWFEGCLADLAEARQSTTLPVLCKDFLVSEFQLWEAAAHGADAVLLIAAALTDATLRELTRLARSLGMEVLHEAHDAEEITRLTASRPTLLGVNSRNLKTMEVVPAGALEVGDQLPAKALGVYESGVRGPDDLARAAAAGYRAALVGESLLRAPDPGVPLKALTTWSPGP